MQNALFPLLTTYCDLPPELRKSRKRPRALVFVNGCKRPRAMDSTYGRKRLRALACKRPRALNCGNDRKQARALGCKRLHAFYKTVTIRKTVKWAVQWLAGS